MCFIIDCDSYKLSVMLAKSLPGAPPADSIENDYKMKNCNIPILIQSWVIGFKNVADSFFTHKFQLLSLYDTV